jgi:hypothetical protein
VIEAVSTRVDIYRRKLKAGWFLLDMEKAEGLPSLWRAIRRNPSRVPDDWIIRILFQPLDLRCGTVIGTENAGHMVAPPGAIAKSAGFLSRVSASRCILEAWVTLLGRG